MDLKLSEPEIGRLKWIASNANSAQVRKAEIVLACAHGMSIPDIAEQVELTPRRVRFWIRGFDEKRMGIFPEGTEPSEAHAEEQKTTEPEPKVTVAKKEAVKPPSIRELVLRKKMSTPGIKADDRMSEAGRKVLLFHFQRMLKHERGTRLGKEIEELHKMRVAIRRMRSAARIFRSYYKGSAFRQHIRALRRAGRALGPVRDLDVFTDKAMAFLAEESPDQPRPLDVLLEQWRARRESAREKMLAYLDGKRYAGMVAEFGRFLVTEGAGARKARKRKPTADRVYQVVPQLVYSRYQRLRSYEPIMDGAPITTLHALRIDCKRFRYTLEFFEEVLGPEAKPVIKAAVRVQDHLGALHDADVACILLIEFLENWGDTSHRDQIDIRGVTHYLAAKQDELRELVTAVPKVWSEFVQADVRRNLGLAVAAL